MSPIIKIAKPGRDISSLNPDDWNFNSDYTVFKYHDDITESMTINAGDTTKTVTIAHNLGYVPAFMAYRGDNTGITGLPYRRGVISGQDDHLYAYADATNIYIVWKCNVPYLEYICNGIYFYDDTYGYDQALVGNVLGSGKKCSMVFGNGEIAKNASISSAILSFKVNHKGWGIGDIKMKIYGIDVDEITDYDTFGSSKTTAEITKTDNTLEGNFFGTDVKSIVEEITTRSGFVNYSPLGFYFEDNGSPYDCCERDDTYSSYLTIRLTGSFTENFRVVVFKDKIHD